MGESRRDLLARRYADAHGAVNKGRARVPHTVPAWPRGGFLCIHCSFYFCINGCSAPGSRHRPADGVMAGEPPQ